MSSILFIDPGKHSGWAYFVNRWLVACDKFDPEKTPFPVYGAFDVQTQVFIELPRGRGGKTAASVDSLIALGIRTGLVKGPCIERNLKIEMIEAVKWTGDLPKCKTQKEHLGEKDVRHNRVRERLYASELALLEGTKSSDVWDAVGGGLWACGRFGRWPA